MPRPAQRPAQVVLDSHRTEVRAARFAVCAPPFRKTRRMFARDSYESRPLIPRPHRNCFEEEAFTLWELAAIYNSPKGAVSGYRTRPMLPLHPPRWMLTSRVMRVELPAVGPASRRKPTPRRG